MRKSVIAFGIFFSVAFNTINANTNPDLRPTKLNRTKITNVSPLNLAIVEANLDAVKTFVDFGANIEEATTKSNGMRPLMYAARYNQVELLEYLIEKGAKVDAKSKIGATALDYAKAAGAKEAVTFLSNL